MWKWLSLALLAQVLLRYIFHIPYIHGRLLAEDAWGQNCDVAINTRPTTCTCLLQEVAFNRLSRTHHHPVLDLAQGIQASLPLLAGWWNGGRRHVLLARPASFPFRRMYLSQALNSLLTTTSCLTSRAQPQHLNYATVPAQTANMRLPSEDGSPKEHAKCCWFDIAQPCRETAMEVLDDSMSSRVNTDVQPCQYGVY